MDITKRREGTTLTITATGRLDASSATQLEEAIHDSLEGVEHLVLDFGGVPYMSSAGLRVVIHAQQVMEQQGSMEMRNVSPQVMEVFEMTGFDGILNFT